ncbi:hypothetical protein BVX95_00205 [archaeon D22]|nr:hypothetical protein BVX95_00205 [archaeon D22]
MDRIAVLDFGGQYAHLIANRIRRVGVYSEIFHSDVSADALKDFKGIIFSGGPQNISEDDSLKCDSKIFDLGIPILGICYGHQLTQYNFGGEISRGKTKEYGRSVLNIVKKVPLFEGLGSDEIMWMSHGDYVSKLGAGFEIIGSTEDCETAAVYNQEKNIYGIQFHPEVTHSVNGMKIFENFVNLCDCKKSWDMNKFIEEETSKIKEFVGDRNVFLLVSGGVDSNVCFALLNKALGSERVYGLHIDNGFMRLDESKKVEDKFREIGFDNFHVVDSSEVFLSKLIEKYEPEEKRKIIGHTFIDVQQEELAKLGLDPEKWVLGQGTIYPDTIESGGTKNSKTIKTHHNRVEIIEKLISEGKVIEPIKELYKDEVREVGKLLGLPDELIDRHPFPGPGLGVRCLCAKENFDASKDATKKSNEIAKENGLSAFVLPIKSVGVQGDARTYNHPVALFGGNGWDNYEKASIDITNNVEEVNRGVRLLSDTNLKNAKVVDSYLTRDRLDKLRIVDDIVSEFLKENNLYDKIWQFPVVLVPLSFEGGESIVLRPINSVDAMSASFSRIDEELLKSLTEKIMAVEGVDAVFYDVTNKPPGTIEWE